MYLKNQRKVEIQIKEIMLDNNLEFDEIELVYNFHPQAAEMEKKFTIIVESLHNYLFSDIKILIKSKGKILGGFKTSIKALESKLYEKMPLISSNTIFTADYLDKEQKIVGEISFLANIVKLERDLNEPKQSIHIHFINTIFNKFLNDFAARIFNLTFSLQEGSFRCKVKAILGFMTTQIHHNLLYKPCNDLHTDSLCEDTNCFSKYDKIGSKMAKIGTRGAHYAIIAYSHINLPLFGPKKLRKVQCNDPIKKNILEHALITEEDIIKISHNNRSSTFISFFDKNEMIITFRGTFSIKELFNALDARYVPFEDGFAHDGFLRLAKDFIQNEFPDLAEILLKKKCKSLILVGHSLGGAVGTMVYLLLKTDPKYKNLFKNVKIQVLSYSAPPTVSKNIAQRHYQQIIGFNYDFDVVPQLSYGSLLDFKFLCVTIQAKWLAFLLIFKGKKQFFAEIDKIRDYLRKSNIHEKLYAPGRVYHIRGARIKGSIIYRYKLVNLNYFDEIRYTINSFICHLLFNIVTAFKNSNSDIV